MICKEKIYFKSEILPGFSQKRMCDLFKFRFRRKTGKGSNLIYFFKNNTYLPTYALLPPE